MEEQFFQEIFIEQINLNPNNRKIRNVGTCGITVLIYNDKIFVANCGDSQAILLTANPLLHNKYN